MSTAAIDSELAREEQPVVAELRSRIRHLWMHEPAVSPGRRSTVLAGLCELDTSLERLELALRAGRFGDQHRAELVRCRRSLIRLQQSWMESKLEPSGPGIGAEVDLSVHSIDNLSHQEKAS